MTTRRTLVWKLSAVVLLLLAASPFTAPFSTFDLDGQADLPYHAGVDTAKKLGHDSLPTVVMHAEFVPPHIRLIAGGPSDDARCTASRGNRHRVLRL